MDTARYLTICQTTLFLPTLLKEHEDLGRYLKQLGTFPLELRLEDGFNLKEHLELIIEANPSQAYLRQKRLFKFEDLVLEIKKFQQSKGYKDLQFEVQAVSRDPNRPHKFLTPNQNIQPTIQAAKEPTLIEVVPQNPIQNDAIPTTDSENNQKEKRGRNLQGEGYKKTISPKEKLVITSENKVQSQNSIQGGSEPILNEKYQIKKPNRLRSFFIKAKAKLSLGQIISKKRLNPLTSYPRPSTIRIGGSQPRFQLLKFRFKPTPIISGPLKSIVSQAKIQIIRHPISISRAITAVIGGAIGSLLGGPGSAAGGAVIGALTGPSIINNLMTLGTQQPNSGNFPEENLGSSGESPNSARNFLRNGLNFPRRGLAPSGRIITAAAQRSALLLANPTTWVVLVAIFIILIILLAFFSITCSINLPFLANCSEKPPNQTLAPSSKIKLEKTGPVQVENADFITYKIVVTNISDTPQDLIVTDKIPPNTTFISGDNDLQPEGVVTEAKWTIKQLTPNTPKTLSLSIKPTTNDIWVSNQAIAELVLTNNLPSDSSENETTPGIFSNILPNPLPPAIANWGPIKTQILSAVNQYTEVILAYKKASELTGVPWQILAGLHYVETGSGPNPGASLVSGRKIGTVEPDIPPAACAQGESGPGVPVPIGSGCGFTNFEDSAIYAAKHIISKIGKVPQSYSEAVTALSRYNGGGNRNCDRGVPYGTCPPDFYGEDDPYPMSDFDEEHDQMFLIYCGDRLQCSSPRAFNRPGAMAVIRALTEGTE